MMEQFKSCRLEAIGTNKHLKFYSSGDTYSSEKLRWRNQGEPDQITPTPLIETPETKTKTTITIESMRAILRILGGPGDQ